MSTLVTRSGKGSPLTHNEVDTNFTNLNTDKVEKTAADITGGTINNTTVGATTPSTGVFTTLTAQTEVLKGTGNNFLLNSQGIGGTNWALAGTTTATLNNAVAPDSTTTASLISNATDLIINSNNVRSGTTSLVSNATYTASIYLKLGTATTCGISLRDASTGATTNATMTTSGSWVRVSATLTTGASTTRLDLMVGGANGTFFAWGAQLEFGSTANTYIPTTTTAVYGTPTLSFSGVASIGLQSDGSLYETSAGTGNVRFYTNNIAQEQARVSHTASAVNYHQLTGSATGSGPIHSVAGSDTNIDLNLTTKGTGSAYFRSGNGILARFNDLGATVTAYPLISASQYDRVYFGADGTGTNLSIQYTTKGSASHIFATSVLGTQQASISHTASAVNYVNVTGAATGLSPVISAQGSDANIQIQLQAKGTGLVRFTTGGGLQAYVSDTVSAVNYVGFTGGATGFGPRVFAAGTDTNIPLVVQPKGTGALQAQQTDSTATGGNARGANAVDWQTSRASASQVASGAGCVVGGGYANIATVGFSTVAGGFNNTGGYLSTVVGGQTNQSTGTAHGFAGAGYLNTANGFLNVVVGGASNSGTSASTVTTQSATMNGTTAVTLSGSNANIKVGQLITGTSIATYTYVAAISGTSLTLSQAASGSSTSTLSFYTPHGVVVGGGNNQATGSYSYIGGGGDAGTAANRNVASGDWSVVCGGIKNTASGQASFVGGGGITGGTVLSNTASGNAASTVGGFNNTSSGFGAFIGGGFNNISNGTYSAIMAGSYGSARGISGIHVSPASNNPFSTTGSNQSSLLLLAAQTTNATATVLTSDVTAAGTTNQIIMPNNSAYAFRGTVIANVTGGGNTKAWAIEGAIKRGANAASTALVGTPTVTSAYADVGAATWAITATADTTNGGLAITFTGQAGTTIRVVAKLETTEVTF